MEESSNGKKSPPEEHQEAQFDHVPRTDSVCSKVHLVQCICHMRVTIVAAYVVHPLPIFRVGQLYRLVPLLPLGGEIATGKGRNVQPECARRFSERHSSSITNTVRALEVRGDTFGIGYAHMADEGEDVRDGGQRRPKDTKGKAVVGPLVGAWPTTTATADGRSSHLNHLSRCHTT